MIRVVSTCRDVPCYKVFQLKKHVHLLRRRRPVVAVVDLDERDAVAVADAMIEAETVVVAVVDAEIIKPGFWDGVAA